MYRLHAPYLALRTSVYEVGGLLPPELFLLSGYSDGHAMKTVRYGCLAGLM